jgi:hypothetical protein
MTSLLRIAADFDTQLASNVAIGDTTATLVSATDDDGVALPTGLYGLTYDAGNSSKEYIICTLTSTAITNVLSISRQGVTTTGFARAHRRGAKVTLTDWAILSRILNNLNGTTGFDSAVKLGYDADPAINSGDVTKFATVKFVNDTAVAGGVDATTTTKGIGKVSVAPVSAANPIFVGDNDPRVPTQGENDALVGNNTDIAVGTGNKFVTQTGFQKQAEVFAVDGSASSTAYTATLAPVPTSLSNGMPVRVKIGLANTITTPTLNVNDLGAKTIVKAVNTALGIGDIAAGMYCTFLYDTTNTVWVLQNPVATTPTSIEQFTQKQIIRGEFSATPAGFTYASTSTAGFSTTNPFFMLTSSSGGGGPKVTRYIKLGNGSVVATHSVSTSGMGTNTTAFGITVIGNYVYALGNDGASNPVLNRFDIADLGNVTTMTISGTALSYACGIFTDGTNLYNMYTAGTAKKYTISGTTATSSTDTNYTSSSTQLGYWSDGTYLYGIGSTGTYRWPIAGGSRTSGTSLFATQYILTGTIQSDGGAIFKEVGNTAQILTLLTNGSIGSIIPVTTF